MNKTVLLVTHDPSEASAVCDRVAVLRGGAIARVWTADDWPVAGAPPIPVRSAAG